MGGVAHPGGDVVVIVAFDQVQLLDVAGPLEVFTAANRCAGPRYDVRVVSPDGHDTVTSCGLRICVDASLEELPERPHTLVVPGRRDWRRATTHWELAAQLASAYPGVRVEPDLLFVRDRHLVTSAGVTAGIDMALALVEEDHGADVARDVARQLVVFMARPGGQSQFSVRMTPPSRHPLVRRVMDVITADPSVPSGMDALAAGAGISTRHLNRLFRQETGMTPGRYVDAVRLEAAKALLSSGTATVGEVARQAGFGSPEAMRRLFQNTFGVSPTVYRARFRSTSASA
ncbi:GlxA family transcriptional regulator [Streptomyces parvulus]|uniref:GlxA family transcriptional regulator n=1 Tax=Streptomyces parvulus TaxID=146923 RepID=UPI0033A071D8